MAAVEVDFEVFKALTARRATEAVTYNDVIRELLGLGTPAAVPTMTAAGGCVFKGVHFPEGTQFRTTYKGTTYTAEIKGGAWVGSDGKRRKSPSDAAHGVTGTNVNGWRFWECKRPSDPSWRVMDELR